ncbi:ABC transporter ATP-binding protein [Phytohabitans kaempferiae]|uniref:ABC transporter ATP-binding protein n=1 Tax=Phytohabitans kaempferiae TaxID=1620943 RepID=A0ABV6M6X9_9ACTN
MTAVSTAAGVDLMTVRDLTVRFPRLYGNTPVVDRVSFAIRPGEVVGLVGESGSGKTLVSLALLGLFPRGSAVTGSVRLRDRDLVAASERERRALRGRSVAMVYQDALTSLNPSLTIRRQFAQIARLGGSRPATELLDLVRLPDAARLLASYPHQLSGGQRQRVLIAMALARDPDLVVADEPTTALDVTVQAQILDLLLRLTAEVNFSLLLVSHDLGVIRHAASRAMVMYAGQLVEAGPTQDLLDRPRHRYTAGLVAAGRSLEAGGPVTVIGGAVPSPDGFTPGCRFAGRCDAALSDCVEPLVAVSEGDRWHACRHPQGRAS